MIQCLSDMNLRNKFLAWSALLLIGFGLLASTLYYLHLKSLLIRDALDTSEVILLEVESIREYVKNVLRPTISRRESPDTFIIEVMSSTYVSLNIMRRFGAKKPGYSFRRASLNPLNSENRADAFEEEMFSWFEEDPSRTLWRGIVPRNGKLSFVTIIPDYMEKSCLRCHGDPSQAPAEIVRRYGTAGGFRFKEGNLAGINSVSIPVADAFARIRRNSIGIFIIIQTSAVLLLILFNILFNKLVIRRLSHVSSTLTKKKTDRQPTHDELDLLRQSVTTLSRYVRAARKGADLQPNFIDSCTIGTPITGGTLSWIYEGRDLKRNRDISIKTGLGEVLVNPLYATCLQVELRIFAELRHDCVPDILEKKEDMLIMEPLPKMDLAEWIQSSRNNILTRKTVLARLCDLVAELHTAGIVHHDLRPEIFLIGEREKEIKITDMGLASRRDIQDVILSSGLGPQGDFASMAPEQLQGERSNPLSDIYALGVLLYRIVTRTVPFATRPSSPRNWHQAKKEVVPPSAHGADITPELELIILKAMAWEPAKRYQWIEDLWDELDKAL
ncbi:c-type heme family protein [Desulfolithobacter sp.]